MRISRSKIVAALFAVLAVCSTVPAEAKSKTYIISIHASSRVAALEGTRASVEGARATPQPHR